MDLILASAAVPPVRAQEVGGGETGDDHTACVLRETLRQIVAVSGGELYVEPETFSVSDGNVLLAGTPNYLWKPAVGSGKASSVRNAVFGVVIASDGATRVVPTPVEGMLVMGVRAVAREAGGWWIAFEEAEWTSETRRIIDKRVVALWFGAFDGQSWIALEELPLPADVTIRPFSGSTLVRSGDRLAWTLVAAAGPEDERRVLVYERVAGRWSYQIVPTFSANYAEPAYSRSGELVLAVVEADTTRRVDGNSLFLYARQPVWRQWRKLVTGYGAPVHHPKLSLSPRGDLLTWWSRVEGRREVRARFGAIDGGTRRVIEVDPDVAQFALVSLADGRRVWVTDHVVDGQPVRELRFVGEAADSLLAFGDIPNPYDGKFAATTPAPSELLLAGPARGRTDHDPVVRSLLLRLRIDCGADVP
ncbi:MAG TPA: hypothetical protein VF188_18910 [Longimicrobiales bacterium]